MSVLKPGEIKILKALNKGPKSYGNLQKETRLSNNALSPYLTSLQNENMIRRETDRRYYITELSYASLFFNDIKNFIDDYLKNTVNKDLKKNILIYKRSMLIKERVANTWLVLTDRKEIAHKLKEALNKPRIMLMLLEIGRIIEEEYTSYIFNNYKLKEKKIIETYNQYLLEFVKKISLQHSDEEWMDFKKCSLEIARIKLKESYPGVTIPEEMIKIEAEKETEKFLYGNAKILHPYNLEGIDETWDSLNSIGQSKKDFSEEDKKELEDMLDFLENKKNKKLYEAFLKSRDDNRAKTLLLCPSLGFKGYLEKWKEKSPEKYQEQFVDGFYSHLNEL